MERMSSRATAAIGGITGASAAASAGVAAALGGASAAFIGLGAVALRENDRVKQSFAELSDTVNEGLAQDAAVLQSAFTGAADDIAASYEKLRPQMREAFAASEPHVATLTAGVTGFAEQAMPGMVNAVQSADPVMEGFRQLMVDTGAGTREFFDIVSQGSEQAGQGVQHFGQLVQDSLPEIGGILTNLNSLWAEHGDEVVSVVTRMLGVINDLSGSALPVLGEAVGAAATALQGVLDVIEPMSGEIGTLIGVWLSLKSAMQGMRVVQGILGNASLSVRNFGKQMGTTRGRVKGAVGGIVGAIALIGGALENTFGDDEYRANMEALTLGLERWANTGRIAGEASRFLGDNTSELKDAFSDLHGPLGAVSDLKHELADAMPGLSSSMKEAENWIGKLDKALAQMVEKGKGGVASEVLRRVAKRANEAGVSTEELTGMLPKYSAAQEVAAGKSGKSAKNSKKAGEAFDQMGVQAQDASAQIDQMVSSLDKAVKSTFKARSSEVSYEAALDRASEAVKKNGANLDINTEAGRKNRKSLDKLAQSALDHAGAMAKDGESLNNVRGYMRNARGEFINMATDMGKSTWEARQLANNLGLIPGNYYASVTVDYVMNQFSQTGPLLGMDPFAGLGFANGGLVGFPRGGMLRGSGGPRSDSNLIAASDGEFVVNSQDTKENLDLLRSINSGKVSSGDAQAVMGSGGSRGGGGSSTVTVRFDTTGADEGMKQLIRKMVRVDGNGDVRVALEP